MSKHTCDRRQKFIDVNFASLVARTGREIGTNLILDDPELCGVVATKKPPLQRTSLDYATLRLLADISRVQKKSEKDADRKNILNLLTETGVVFLRQDRRRAVVTGTRGKLDGDLNNLDAYADAVKHIAQKRKNKDMQNAVAIIKKAIDERQLITLEELNFIFEVLGKELTITKDDAKSIKQELSKMGILAPEEIDTTSDTVWVSVGNDNTMRRFADSIAPSLVVRQDGKVTTKKCLEKAATQTDAAESNTNTRTTIPQKSHEDKGSKDEGGAAHPKRFSQRTKKASLTSTKESKRKKSDPMIPASDQKTLTGSTDVSNKEMVVQKMISSYTTPKSKAILKSTSASRSVTFMEGQSKDEENNQMLVILSLLASLEDERRPLTDVENHMIRDFIESKANVPIDTIQTALNHAVSKNMITVKQANDAFAELTKKAKGSKVVSLLTVRRLFDQLLLN